MPINANYEYTNAEARYLVAQTNEEKLIALEESAASVQPGKWEEGQRWRGG